MLTPASVTSVTSVRWTAKRSLAKRSLAKRSQIKGHFCEKVNCEKVTIVKRSPFFSLFEKYIVKRSPVLKDHLAKRSHVGKC